MSMPKPAPATVASPAATLTRPRRVGRSPLPSCWLNARPRPCSCRPEQPSEPRNRRARLGTSEIGRIGDGHREMFIRLADGAADLFDRRELGPGACRVAFEE